MSEVSENSTPFAATLYDGLTAARRDVSVSLTPTGLAIAGEGGQPIATWAYRDVRLVDEDRRTGPVRLRSATDDAGALLRLPDRGVLAAIVRHAPHLAQRRQFSRAVVIPVAGLVGTAALAGVLWFGLPWAARISAAAIPVSWEESLGEKLYVEVIKIFGVVGDGEPAVCAAAPGTTALQRLLTRLSPATSPYDFRVTVLDVSEPNAFALPGGHMVILQGLLDFVEGPEEVAGVLAHEIGHVVHRDGTQEMIRQLGLQGILSLFFGGGTPVAIGETLLTFSFSREAEAEADTAALGLLRGAGLQTAGLGEFFQRLIDQQGDMAGGLEFLSTHPSSASRVRYFDEANAAGDGPAMSDTDWQALRAICGA